MLSRSELVKKGTLKTLNRNKLNYEKTLKRNIFYSPGKKNDLRMKEKMILVYDPYKLNVRSTSLLPTVCTRHIQLQCCHQLCSHHTVSSRAKHCMCLATPITPLTLADCCQLGLFIWPRHLFSPWKQDWIKNQDVDPANGAGSQLRAICYLTESHLFLPSGTIINKSWKLDQILLCDQKAREPTLKLKSW